jgi:uncharacterized protein (TIGR02265 family)
VREELFAGRPLTGDVDIEAVCSELPREFVIKGMFVQPYAEALQREWEAFGARLLAPPRRGRYVPFQDYPIADFLRLFDAVARRRHPGTAGREAYRLLARNEVATFFASTLGRVAVSMIDEPGAALLKYPETFGVLARGPSAAAERIGLRAVRVSFANYRGSFEYVVGVLEGLVMAFQQEPHLVVEARGDYRYVCDVAWTAPATG